MSFLATCRDDYVLDMVPYTDNPAGFFETVPYGACAR